MSEKQDVKFLGLTNSPSDYDCQDGELATCLNLINEDGALHPIHQPVYVNDNVTIGANEKIEFVHKVTHDDSIHLHYICYNSELREWTWFESYQEDERRGYLSALQGFQANSVTAIGNVICFVGDNSVKYAFWNKNSYSVLDRSNLQYGIEITNTYNSGNVSLKVEAGDDFWKYFLYIAETKEELRVITTTTASGTRKMFNDLDAIANKKLEEFGIDYFKRNVIGVAAMRLYDGTYINISNPFVLPHNDGNHDSRRINIYRNVVKPTAPNGKTIISGVNFNKFDIEIRMIGNLNGIEDLIQGVDIFLSDGESFFQLDKAYEVQSDPQTTDWINLNDLSEKDWHEAIGNLSFYHSLFIPVGSFEHRQTLKRPYRTEESISLADLNRIDFGGDTAITYNNRLHVAGVRKNIDNSLVIQPTYSDGNNEEAIYEIITNNGTYYLSGYFDTTAKIISVPISDVKMIYVTIKFSELAGYARYKYNLYSPPSFGLSFFVKVSAGDIIFVESGVTSEVVTQDDWNNLKEKVSDFLSSSSKGNYSPSLIRVSEAENPLVFPAKNSVQVGSAIIQALAANTRPISEGQFGEAPLYAFTDEGVWVLMLGEEGTYQTRQPASRDICSNPKGILQIDDAVLFPTDKGIMMQQGRNSICITDAIDFYPFKFLSMYKGEVKRESEPTGAKKFTSALLEMGNIPESDVDYEMFRKYLKESEMIYDYYDSRIIVFNPNYTYAYVYSLKSQMWGTMHSPFRNRINIYPEAYAINKDGMIVNAHVQNPTDSVPFFLCSRPLSLGYQNIYKTMFNCITRAGFWTFDSGKCGMVLFGSNDMVYWYFIGSSTDIFLRNLVGSPYKYFRIILMGNISANESISSISTNFIARLQNKLR